MLLLPTSRLRFPSPALILSCLALFAALGGGAYAATAIGSSGIHFKNATLKNGWVNWGDSQAPAGYAKDSLGVVHLRGGIKGGASMSTAFILPSGLRPRHNLYLPIYTLNFTEGSVLISRRGAVHPIGSQASGFSSLDGISFAAGE